MLTHFSALLVSCLALSASALPKPLPKNDLQIITSCINDKQVALTFDDGPYNFEMDILKTLKKYNAKGTFFLNGNNWDCIYNQVDSVQAAVTAGHQIASHTWAHRNLTTLNQTDLISEMERTDQAIAQMIGKWPAFMRPPYGSYNDLVIKTAHSRGQYVALWDLDSWDSDNNSTLAQSKAKYDAIIAKRPKNMLTLNHETTEYTVKQLLPYAIEKLQAAGYHFVTVATCTNLPPYLNKTADPNGPTTC